MVCFIFLNHGSKKALFPRCCLPPTLCHFIVQTQAAVHPIMCFLSKSVQDYHSVHSHYWSNVFNHLQFPSCNLNVYFWIQCLSFSQKEKEKKSKKRNLEIWTKIWTEFHFFLLFFWPNTIVMYFLQ